MWLGNVPYTHFPSRCAVLKLHQGVPHSSRYGPRRYDVRSLKRRSRFQLTMDLPKARTQTSSRSTRLREAFLCL